MSSKVPVTINRAISNLRTNGARASIINMLDQLATCKEKRGLLTVPMRTGENQERDAEDTRQILLKLCREFAEDFCAEVKTVHVLGDGWSTVFFTAWLSAYAINSDPAKWSYEGLARPLQDFERDGRAFLVVRDTESPSGPHPHEEWAKQLTEILDSYPGEAGIVARCIRSVWEPGLRITTFSLQVPLIARQLSFQNASAA